MSKKVLVELFTLDSGGCAPCTYMKEMVDDVSKTIDGEIEVVEHKIKEKAAVKLMKERGVTAIPTLCIDGEIMYESIIPGEDELKEELLRRLQG